MNVSKENLTVSGIPAILWGDKSEKMFIAVHGNMSSKDDECITMLAENVLSAGYQVLSFDLPEHGERNNDLDYICNAQNCVRDLNIIKEYAYSVSADVSLFACSMGAYFSLVAFQDGLLDKCLFLSPVLNMERIINNLMSAFDVSEEKLKSEKEILLPIGQKLYWDYYCFVKSNKITSWEHETEILSGSEDDLCESDVLEDFVKNHKCYLTVMQGAEHYFHTSEQLDFFRTWVCNSIK